MILPPAVTKFALLKKLSYIEPTENEPMVGRGFFVGKSRGMAGAVLLLPGMLVALLTTSFGAVAEPVASLWEDNRSASQHSSFSMSFSRQPVPSLIRKDSQDRWRRLGIPVADQNANERARPYFELDTRKVPEWNNLNDLKNAFERLRDTQFLRDSEGRDRRLSWLYPDDGCYARAELMVHRLEREGNPSPMKIFAFGGMSMSTPYTYDGFIRWSYHIAIAYRSGGTIYVLDPSVYLQRPLTLNEWIQRIGNPSNLTLAFCSAHTYGMYNNCDTSSPSASYTVAMKDQALFLDMEWDRLRKLGRRPDQELGQYPPWKASPRTIKDKSPESEK